MPPACIVSVKLVAIGRLNKNRVTVPEAVGLIPIFPNPCTVLFILKYEIGDIVVLSRLTIPLVVGVYEPVYCFLISTRSDAVAVDKLATGIEMAESNVLEVSLTLSANPLNCIPVVPVSFQRYWTKL